MLCDYSNPDRLDLVDRLGQSEDRNFPGSVVVCLKRAFDEAVHLNPLRYRRRLRTVRAVELGRTAARPLENTL